MDLDSGCFIKSAYLTKEPSATALNSLIARSTVRWFVLYDYENIPRVVGCDPTIGRFRLLYFKNRESMRKNQKPAGMLKLDNADVQPSEHAVSRAKGIKVVTGSRSLLLSSDDRELIDDWLATLQQCANGETVCEVPLSAETEERAGDKFETVNKPPARYCTMQASDRRHKMLFSNADDYADPWGSVDDYSDYYGVRRDSNDDYADPWSSVDDYAKPQNSRDDYAVPRDANHDYAEPRASNDDDYADPWGASNGHAEPQCEKTKLEEVVRKSVAEVASHIPESDTDDYAIPYDTIRSRRPQSELIKGMVEKSKGVTHSASISFRHRTSLVPQTRKKYESMKLNNFS